MNRMNWQRYQIAIIAWFESQPIELQAAFPMNRWRSLFRLGSKGRQIPYFDTEEVLDSMLGGDEQLRTVLVEPLCAHLNAAFGNADREDVRAGAAGGAPVDTAGGAPVDAAGGAPVDTAGGAPVDAAGGAPVDAAGGVPVDAAAQGEPQAGRQDVQGAVFPGFAPGGSHAFAANPLAMLSPYDMPWVDDAPGQAEQQPPQNECAPAQSTSPAQSTASVENTPVENTPVENTPAAKPVPTSAPTVSTEPLGIPLSQASLENTVEMELDTDLHGQINQSPQNETDKGQDAAIAAATAKEVRRAAHRAAVSPHTAGVGEDGQEWNFPEYDFSRPDLSPLVSVRCERTRDGLRYTWRDAGDSEIYRIVVETGGFSTDVDLGHTVCWTRQSHAIDPRPADSPCRFITVWGYEDLGGGELGQCRRVAAGVYIAQVEDLQVEVIGTSVRAQWVVPGAPVGAQTDTEVVVARLPGDANVGMEIQTESWLNHTLASNMYNCLDGIEDSTGTPGQRYMYLAAVKVKVGNRFEMGRPVVFKADLQQAPLARPQHFSVNADVSAGGNFCTLTWQAVPGTRVRIFRTTRSPHSAVAEQPTVGVEQLADAGLHPQDELHATPTPCPGQEGRGLVQLTAVEWPDGAEYDRLYFTPVATRDGLASVGPTQVLVRSGEIADVRLVQRLDWQLLTFAWPGEAACVQLRRISGQGPVPVDGPQAAAPDLTCTRQEYSRQGGFVICGGGETWGSQVQLNAVSYYDGQPIYGRPTLVDIDPLYRFEYTLDWPGGARAMFKLLGKSKHLVRLTVKAMPGSPCPPHLLPHLMLVHNRQYLPLHWRDGTPVPVSPEADGRDSASQLNAFPAPSDQCVMFFPADALEGGYVRLMVCAEPEAVHGRANTAAWAYAAERYALEDPDAQFLLVEH